MYWIPFGLCTQVWFNSAWKMLKNRAFGIFTITLNRLSMRINTRICTKYVQQVVSPNSQKHTLTHSPSVAAESTRMFVCTERVMAHCRKTAVGDEENIWLQSWLGEAEPFSSLWLKGGWLVVWRREHAWVALGDKQTFIPAVSCLLDLQGATDSSWIHLALVKHVQRYRVFTRPGRSTVHPEQPRRQLSLLEMIITWRYCPACKPYQIAVTQCKLDDEVEE